MTKSEWAHHIVRNVRGLNDPKSMADAVVMLLESGTITNEELSILIQQLLSAGNKYK